MRAKEWYENTPVGKNKMTEYMKVISEKAGLSAIYTNHCIRATLVSKLHHAGVSAQGIMSISGHKNVKESSAVPSTFVRTTQRVQQHSCCIGGRRRGIHNGNVPFSLSRMRYE